MDSYAWFQRPGAASAASSTRPRSSKVADGRVFTGRQALELKLSTSSATSRPRSPGSPRRRTSTPRRRCATTGCSPRFGDLPFLHVAAIGLLDAVGLAALAAPVRGLGRVQAVERLNLDGLLALWHPPSTN